MKKQHQLIYNEDILVQIEMDLIETVTQFSHSNHMTVEYTCTCPKN